MQVPQGPYRLRFSFTGYGTVNVPDLTVGTEPTEVPELVLPGLPGQVAGRVVLPAGFDAPLQSVDLCLVTVAALGDDDPAASLSFSRSAATG